MIKHHPVEMDNEGAIPFVLANNLKEKDTREKR